ncbi:heme oxygenase [Pseudogracilibacillus sp. SE30717A]|uniref:heme oxygenase n=1 Tax=Pseudogracilibacillus sp. SE30717A TaxID=3098293 RepID=UPI00300DEB18
MYIVTNTTKIKKDEGIKLINRFNKVGKVEMMEGFLGLEVLETQKLKDYDEVTIVTRWETEDNFKNWTKSEAFKEAHRHNGGRPDYIIENKISYYKVPIVRHPITSIAK